MYQTDAFTILLYNTEEFTPIRGVGRFIYASINLLLYDLAELFQLPSGNRYTSFYPGFMFH
jgi:hypothetical protein